MVLWLWGKPAAAAQFDPIAWDLPYAKVQLYKGQKTKRQNQKQNPHGCLESLKVVSLSSTRRCQPVLHGSEWWAQGYQRNMHLALALVNSIMGF